jgi:hypothetical protein
VAAVLAPHQALCPPLQQFHAPLLLLLLLAVLQPVLLAQQKIAQGVLQRLLLPVPGAAAAVCPQQQGLD